MRLLLTILIISFQSNKQKNIPINKNGDTTLWYIWRHKRDDDIKLKHLITSTDSIHFRFWTNGQAVDIWSNDYKIFYGQLTNYADKYEKKENKPLKTFSNQVQIDTSLPRKTFELIKTINNIPSEDSIKDWKQGNDGIEYLFESSTPNYYAFKHYWTPHAQESTLVEAKQIQSFVDKIYLMLNLKVEYDKFFETLKSGSYSNDGFIMMSKIKLTKRQYKKWKKYEEGNKNK